ncbi:MAG: DUF4236 domain-containing protein [Chloroflexia bacterium]
MGFRFRRSIKILPGVRLSLGKSGLGLSASVRGARYSVGPSGRRTTFSIPGTGLSYVSRSHKQASPRRANHVLVAAPKPSRSYWLIIAGALVVLLLSCMVCALIAGALPKSGGGHAENAPRAAVVAVASNPTTEYTTFRPAIKAECVGDYPDLWKWGGT